MSRSALPVALAAAWLLATNVTEVRAAGIIPHPGVDTALYQLINLSPVGTAPVTSIEAEVSPPGTVIPRDGTTSPLTILPDSFGFDQNNLQVALGSGQAPAGGTVQALALNFGPGGFQPGGVLNFALAVDHAFQGTPTLQLPTSATGLEIIPLSGGTFPPNSDAGGGGGGGVSVPEPMTIVLWSAGALGLGLFRVRSYRRTRKPLA